jgi:putative DNA primase/helicase
VKGITTSEAIKAVCKVLEIKPKFDAQAMTEDRRNRDAMNRVWVGAGRQIEGGPVHTYLKRRTGRVWPSISIREHTSLVHPVDGLKFPAMLGKIVDQKGNPMNLHITYLMSSGHKADVSKNKVFMAGKLPDGSCIRLMPHYGILGIAEGIETALSASVIFNVPVWSACNASLLAKWLPPDDVHKVIIFGDNDQNYHGQAKAYGLAHKLANQYKLDVDVMIPDQAGDWNDRLVSMEKGR